MKNQEIRSCDGNDIPTSCLGRRERLEEQAYTYQELSQLHAELGHKSDALRYHSKTIFTLKELARILKWIANFYINRRDMLEESARRGFELAIELALQGEADQAREVQRGAIDDLREANLFEREADRAREEAIEHAILSFQCGVHLTVPGAA